MDALLLRAGQAAGVLGMLLMAVAVVARLAGHYTLGGYATVTMMTAGAAAVTVGCFLLLWVIAQRGR
jgi:protein-S-isoprenylcysteine O-methyltransferase Ste14